MLAYVFWHWKQASVPALQYEAAQQAFHHALKQAPSDGFILSRSYGVTGYPWAANGGSAYEDWYLVPGSAGLDPLNQAAVSASREASHREAARLADGGTAGLYRLRMPEGPLPDAPPTEAYWFSKPAGLAYDHLWRLLGTVLERSGSTLWIRHMVLGPAPEFCLQSPAPVELPPPLSPLVTPLRQIWP